MPEIRKGRLVDAGARADDVDLSKGRGGGGKEGCELGPGCYVGFVKEGGYGVGGDEGLGFGAEGEVSEDDVGAGEEEEPGEFEVYAWYSGY